MFYYTKNNEEVVYIHLIDPFKQNSKNSSAWTVYKMNADDHTHLKDGWSRSTLDLYFFILYTKLTHSQE